MSTNLKQKNKGFVIFIAAVVTSLLVLIGLLISNISLRQLTFSFAGKNSQIAFTAASSGVECALYWDQNNPTNPSESAFVSATNYTPQTIDCNGQQFVFDASHNPDPNTDPSGADSTLSNGPSAGQYYMLLEGAPDTQSCDTDGNCTITSYGHATTTFRIDYSNDPTTPLPYCTDVSVGKWRDSSGNLKTTIESRGHNPCTSSSKQVERAIRVTYQ